jgi:hypothetical protein
MMKFVPVLWRWREPIMFTTMTTISQRKTLNMHISQDVLVDWGSSHSGNFTIHDEVLLTKHKTKTKIRKLRLKNCTFDPVRTNTKLKCIYRLNSYRAVNTLGLSYKNQWVNVICETNRSLGVFVKSIKATVTSVTSVRLSALNHSAPIGPIFWNFISEYFSKV